MDLRTRQLESFVAVADELHFGRAAARLGVAQSAVSRHVRALEDGLSAVLLERTSRTVALTDAGRAVHDRARAVLAAADDLERAVRSGGALRVAFVANTSPLVAPVVAALARDLGDLRVDTVQLNVPDAVAGLRRGAFDVLVARPYAAEDDLVAEPVGAEDMVLAFPEDHRLAGRDAIDAGRLDGESFVIVERAGATVARVGHERWLAEAGIRARAIRETTTPFAALGLVAGGAGLYRLPRSAAVALPGVRYVPLRGERTAVVLLRTPAPPQAPVAEALRVMAGAIGVAIAPS